MLFSFTLFTNYPSSFSSWNVSILSRNNESLLLRKKCINLYQLILGSYFSIAQFIKLSLQCSTTLENLKFDVWSRVGGFLGFFFRKSKPDANYANAVYKFWRNVPLKIAKMWVFFSADEKCKVPVGEPGYPITTLIRAKESYFWYKWKVYGHKPYFTRLPFIPDSY